MSNKAIKSAEGEVMQVMAQFTTQDETSTPKTSPLAYTTAVITLKVPKEAIQVTFMPTTDMRVSDIVGMTTYDVIKANTKETIGCAGMQNIYIIRDSADGSLNFKFLKLA